MRKRHLEIDAKFAALTAHLAQDEVLAQKLGGMLELAFLFHDNALEGLVFSHEELRVAFDPSFVADRGQIPSLEALKNQRAAIEFVRQETQRRKLRYDPPLLANLHALLSTGAPTDELPKLRKEVPTHRTYFHEIALPGQVTALVEGFAALSDSPDFHELPPVDQAATLHWNLMRIYPFPDHNGRVARLLAQFHLLREGLPLMVIHASDRQRYFEGLSRPLPQFVALMREAMEYSLSTAIQFCENAKPKPPPARAVIERPPKPRGAVTKPDKAPPRAAAAPAKAAPAKAAPAKAAPAKAAPAKAAPAKAAPRKAAPAGISKAARVLKAVPSKAAKAPPPKIPTKAARAIKPVAAKVAGRGKA